MQEGEVLLHDGNVGDERRIVHALGKQRAVLAHVPRRIHQRLEFFEVALRLLRQLLPTLLHSRHCSVHEPAKTSYI